MGSAPLSQPEFREVAHSGGKLTITVKLDGNGRRFYQLQYSHCRAGRAAFFAVYALPPGIVVEQMMLGGLGSIPNSPRVPGCYQVFIGSDSEGRFGRQCPDCSGYWRSDLDAHFCPYCGFQGGVVELLTVKQSFLRATVVHVDG